MRMALVAYGLSACLLAALIPAQAAGAPPDISLQSAPPLAGDYTMVVRVDGVKLASPGSADNTTGHLFYGLNGAPCDKGCATGMPYKYFAPCNGTCSNGAPYITANTTFTYHDLKPGDIISASLLHNDGSDFKPALFVDVQVKNVNQASPGPQIVIDGRAPHPGTPNAGTYTMSVILVDVAMVAPGDATVNDRGQGHLRYLLNGQACVDDCAAGADAETAETTFTFHDLKVGNIVGVELLNNDGKPFYPAVQQRQVVAVPVLQMLSDTPHADKATVTVLVKSFTLVPPTSPVSANNAGAGHIHYLIKHKGDAEFKPAPGDYATASTSFSFANLAEGDTVAAELVNNDHSSLSPKVIQSQEVLAGPQKDPLAPGVGPILAFVILGAAFVARARRE